jgi:phosphatidyl-myo-inositol alpha-mannosyltransferase
VVTPETASEPTLRIALVCPYSLSRPGGVQGQVVGLARALETRGHRATVFAPLDDPADAPTGIELVATGHSVSLPANGSIAPVAVSPRQVARALHLLKSRRFDVAHVHEPFTPGLPYGLLASRHVPPLVATFHRSGPSFFYRLLRPVTRPLANRLALRCAVSEAARSTAHQALGGTYEVVFNGVEIDRFIDVEPWPTGRPSVLFLGRHEERKGLQVLLGTFERLAAAGGAAAPDATGRPHLWIAGDGPETEALRRRYPESPDIHWLGVLSEEEKIRRLVAADVLCAPSLGGESFGMVLLEAMAARTVVVASDIAGYRAAAGGHAVLVPPGREALLAQALEGVLSGSSATEPAGAGQDDGDPGAARHRWLTSAADRAGGWSMEHLAERYEAFYRSVVVEPGA